MFLNGRSVQSLVYQSINSTTKYITFVWVECFKGPGYCGRHRHQSAFAGKLFTSDKNVTCVYMRTSGFDGTTGTDFACIGRTLPSVVWHKSRQKLSAQNSQVTLPVHYFQLNEMKQKKNEMT